MTTQTDATEAHRHECEVRYVVDLQDNAKRREYLEGVAAKRGAAAAQRLREDARALLQQGRSPLTR